MGDANNGMRGAAGYAVSAMITALRACVVEVILGILAIVGGVGIYRTLSI